MGAIVCFQVQRHLRGHPELKTQPVQRSRLGQIARHTIEHIAQARLFGCDGRLAHHVQDDLVWDQLAALEMLPYGPAKIGLLRDVVAQQVARCDMADTEVGRDERALRSLAGARRRNHQYPHTASVRARAQVAYQAAGTMFCRDVVLMAR
jgi:hypothetical protein